MLPEMVLIPAGDFMMGHASVQEGPYSVYLDAFLIATYPVTNADFRRFVEATGYRTDVEGNGFAGVSGIGDRPDANWQHPHGGGSNLTGKERHPVVQVSWRDAQRYCAWLTEVSAGRGVVRTYRLPTEAEWERAARGPGGTLYGYGETFDPTKACVGRDRVTTCPTGEFPPNEYGLYDMGGNVSQLCSDFYDLDYYASAPRRNPKGPPHGDLTHPHGRDMHVTRGGSWATYRGGPLFMLGQPLGCSTDTTGFRLAADP